MAQSPVVSHVPGSSSGGSVSMGWAFAVDDVSSSSCFLVSFDFEPSLFSCVPSSFLFDNAKYANIADKDSTIKTNTTFIIYI